MNDRFKFRVWDIEDYSYFEPRDFDDIWLNEDAELRVGFYSDTTQIIEDYTDNVIIEQCTGLKDKNGNLIYEGDIIFDGYCKRIVKWGGWFWHAESKSAICPLDEFTLRESKIIGNIHEKKEEQ